MQHRRFGRTGLQIPALTFGGGWVGGVLIHKERSVAFATLDRAMDAGMDWIDTAASYGDGQSETVIGEWLANRDGATPPRISTKFRIDSAAGDTAGQIRRSTKASLGRLGLAKVPVLTLHNQITAGGGNGTLRPDDILGSGGVADVLDGLRDEGVCDWIGLTGLGEPAAVIDVVASDRFDTAQVYYNAINPTAAWSPPAGWNSSNFDGLLAACGTNDMGVMGIRILAAGHLATSERHTRQIPLTHNAEADAEAARAIKAWQVFGEASGLPAQAAIRFGLACDGLSTIVVGMAEPEHLELALAAEAAGPLPDKTLAALQTVWRTDPAFAG